MCDYFHGKPSGLLVMSDLPSLEMILPSVSSIIRVGIPLISYFCFTKVCKWKYVIEIKNVSTNKAVSELKSIKHSE